MCQSGSVSSPIGTEQISQIFGYEIRALIVRTLDPIKVIPYGSSRDHTFWKALALGPRVIFKSLQEGHLENIGVLEFHGLSRVLVRLLTYLILGMGSYLQTVNPYTSDRSRLVLERWID
jgi:hypothetical protein